MCGGMMCGMGSECKPAVYNHMCLSMQPHVPVCVCLSTVLVYHSCLPCLSTMPVYRVPCLSAACACLHVGILAMLRH